VNDLNVAQQRPIDNLANQYTQLYSSPCSLFELFLDDDVVNMLVENTNKYAMQKGSNFKTTHEEFRLFIAILFVSGYNSLPRRKMYWENMADVRNEAIASAMSRNRFDELMRFVHVADNDNLNADDRFAKVRPLFTVLNARFFSAFPQQHLSLSIDESMAPYYGRHGVKQCIRGKPIRFGYKNWSINTPLEYCVKLDPYQGAGTTDPILGLGGGVVMKLIADLPPAKYTLFFDNFFTSLKLIDALEAKGFGATGTLRANRVEQCPLTPVNNMKKTARGTFEYQSEEGKNLIVVRWNDNNVVSLASNCHGVEPLGTAKRWSAAQKKCVEITQPFVVSQYNANMGGVDRMDQNIGAYRICIRNKKWWWPLFAYLLDVSMQNAWLLHRLTAAHDTQPLENLEFRRQICHVYFMKYTNRQPSGARPLGRPQPLTTRVPKESRVVHFDGHEIIPSERKRRCAECKTDSRRMCPKCDVGIHVECFFKFHAQ
jgi:DNA excision repair protein ERCC-6